MHNKLPLRILIVFSLFMLLAPGTLRVHAQDDDKQDAEQNTVRIEPAARFAHLTTDNGLVQNAIEAILQDSRGFMWFGTPTGLSCYDGYRFITYRNDPSNPNSLGQNHIRDLYEDKDGIIWIGTEGGGVNRFDPRTETFTRYQPDPQNPNSLSGDRIFAAFQDSKGNFWFGGLPPDNLTRYEPDKQLFTQYRQDQEHPEKTAQLPLGRVGDFTETDGGLLWMIGDNALVRVDLNTEEFTTYKPLPDISGRLSTVLKDSTGTIWMGGDRGLYKFNADQGTFTFYDEFPQINDLLLEETGNFWIASAGGVYRFDPRSEKIIAHYTHDSSVADSLSSSDATTLYRDRSGVIWIGTEGGINIYDPRQAHFALYRSHPRLPEGLTEGAVTAIHVADNVLWTGVNGVLNRVNLTDGEVKRFVPDLPGNSARTIYAIQQDHTGLLWLGMSQYTLLKFDPTSEEFSQYEIKSLAPPGPGPSGPSRSIVAFHEDVDGSLWFAVNHEGLYKLDAQRENLQFFDLARPTPPANNNAAPQAAQPGAAKPDQPGTKGQTTGQTAGTGQQPGKGAGGANPNAKPRPPLTSLYDDGEGKLWIGSWNGLIQFDIKSGTSKVVRSKIDLPGPDSWINAVYADGNGRVWLAARDGLIRHDLKSETVKYYTEKDGLPTSNVVGIVGDKAGDLWLSTIKGIARFSPATETFHSYDVADGLQSNEFITNAFAQAADGQLFFGGPQGLNAFYPDQIGDNPYRPAVVLTGFELFNKPVLPGKDKDSLLTRPIWETDSLSLNYNQNIFSFEFAALNYASSHKNRYRYKLDNFEENWNETTSARRFAAYTNLPAGNYVFRVQATNNNGVWSDKEAALALTVLPPWWETGWFKALMALLVVVALGAGYRWRVHAIQRRNRELERLVTERTQDLQQRTEELQTREEQLRHARDAAEAANRAKSAFLANMSHELRTPLNVILGFAQVTNRNQTEPAEVQENLNIIQRSGEHLLSLINQVLDLSKIEAGHMTVNETDFDFHRMLDDLDDMFILRADDKQLKLMIERPDDLPRYLRTDELKLRQVLINLINNAIKFTEAGGVTVRVRKQTSSITNGASDSTTLQFEIEDTGPGIPADELETLFEAFTQTESGRQSQEGTGLGLPISRKFIELMGGNVSVRSQVGQGTTFAFNIQCQVVEAVSRPSSRIKRRIVALEADQPRYRILIVDDKWANRQLLVKLLSPLGFDLREAQNGKEAVEISEIFKPHLILIDMRMPVMDGYEATRQIKAAPHGKSIFIIALTASAFDEERAAVLAAGCDDFLRKPFRTEKIFELLTSYLGVRYIFEDSQPAVQVTGEQTQPENLKLELNRLPAELLKRLTEGVELGDIGIINKTITEIRQLNATLAEVIFRLAQRFEYSKLLNLLQESVQ